MLNNPYTKPEILEISKQNSILINGEVNAFSMTKAIEEIKIIDQNLPKEQPIYVVLNTPGGSVSDGMVFVSVVKSLGRPVHTITAFAASMGFIIAQHLDKRYILPNGVLMSHRMKAGVQGEVGGELDSFLSFLHAMGNEISSVCADRMGISLEEYKNLIRDEAWFYGNHAIKNKAADSIAVVKCNQDLIDANECIL